MSRRRERDVWPRCRRCGELHQTIDPWHYRRRTYGPKTEGNPFGLICGSKVSPNPSCKHGVAGWNPYCLEWACHTGYDCFADLNGSARGIKAKASNIKEVPDDK